VVFLFLIKPRPFRCEGNWWLFPRRESGRGVKLKIQLHLIPRLRMVEINLHSPYTFIRGA
jgi:hypothetical protein